MSLQERISQELATLGENELAQVAEYVSFLKFRARTSSDEAHLTSLYAEFNAEDRELAQFGMSDYAATLAQEDTQ